MTNPFRMAMPGDVIAAENRADSLAAKVASQAKLIAEQAEAIGKLISERSERVYRLVRECAEQAERVAFLQSQVSDMNAACIELQDKRKKQAETIRELEAMCEHLAPASTEKGWRIAAENALAISRQRIAELEAFKALAMAEYMNRTPPVQIVSASHTIRLACTVPGCARIFGHEGFHATNPELAAKEDGR